MIMNELYSTQETSLSIIASIQSIQSPLQLESLVPKGHTLLAASYVHKNPDTGVWHHCYHYNY